MAAVRGVRRLRVGPGGPRRAAPRPAGATTPAGHRRAPRTGGAGRLRPVSRPHNRACAGGRRRRPGTRGVQPVPGMARGQPRPPAHRVPAIGRLTTVQSALTRYRVIAYVVGVLLLILTLVGIPLQLAGHESVVAIVGPIHGFAYMVYLVIAFDLAVRARWSWRYTILVLLAGTVPFLSFVAERRVTRDVRAALGQPDRQPVRAGSAGDLGQE